MFPRVVAVLTWPVRFCIDSVLYAIAAQRWEGWGRKGDPRNERPLLTRQQWKADRRHDD